MPQQTKAGVTRRPIDLRPPRAALKHAQYYLVEDALGNTTWVRGLELLEQPAPTKVRAIAWRV